MTQQQKLARRVRRHADVLVSKEFPTMSAYDQAGVAGSITRLVLELFEEYFSTIPPPFRAKHYPALGQAKKARR